MKIFRKIRQKLIQKGQVKSYLIYAVGETLLVVVGILIAFQISEWNENRKMSKKESEYLASLSSEINQSLKSIDDAVNFHELTLIHIENIENHILNDLPNSSSLDTSFYVYQYFSIPKITSTTYETIKTAGINSINPDSLRVSITKLYEQEFEFITESLSQTERSFYQNITTNLHIKRFKEKSYLGISEPNNYVELKVDQEYINMLFKLKGLRQFSTNSLKETRSKTSNLLELLELRAKDLK